MMSAISIPNDPIELMEVWFVQMKQLRDRSITYERLVKRDGLRPPVRQVCQLLGVNDITEVFSEDILYRTIVRVAHMQIEERAEHAMEPVYDATSIRPSKILDTLTIAPPQPIDLAHAQLERPPALTALLDLVIKSGRLGYDRYSHFLTLADDAHKEMVNTGVVHIAPKFMATDAKPEKKVATTSSIREIFTHYCVVETFTTTIQPDFSNPEMVLIQLMAFCRDFELYPRLIEKDEIRLILSVMDVRNARMGLKRLRALSFDYFFDFLVRVALFAYHKPAVKKCILKLNNGKMPSKLEIVDYLCQYLHFDDLQWVRDRLKSTKKVTDRCTFGHVVSPTKPSHELTTHDVERPITPRFVKHLEAVTVKTLPFLREKDRQNVSLEGIRTKPKPKPLPPQIESLFSPKLRSREGEGDGKDDASSSQSLRSPSANVSVVGSIVPPSITGSAGNGNGKALSQSSSIVGGNIEEKMVDVASVTEEQRMLINSDLDSSLCRSLGRYAQHTTLRPPSTLWTSSNGCFIDMGRLVKGSEIEIQLLVTNCSPDHVYLDTICKGFDAPDTRVVTKPCSVASGLSHLVQILFTVQPGDKTTIGSIHVFVASMRTGVGLVFEVPVHYRVGPPIPEKDDYLCTLSNLAELQGKYCQGQSPGQRFVNVNGTPNKLLDFHRTNEQMKDIIEIKQHLHNNKFPNIEPHTPDNRTFSTSGTSNF